MITLVIGGSGSGKSDYAETILDNYHNRKIYLATMKIYDKEMLAKVERHKERRVGKHFETVELATDVIKILPMVGEEKCAVLLECISNLVANEMFEFENYKESGLVSGKIFSQVSEIACKADEIVIVTNNVAEDGIVYDQATMEYIKAISEVNIKLAQLADKVVEVVAGIPIIIGESICQS